MVPIIKRKNEMKIPMPWAMFLSCLICVGIGAGAAYSQLVPPPAPQIYSQNADQSFTANDRKMLSAIFLNTLAVRQKLFARVQDGTAIPLTPYEP